MPVVGDQEVAALIRIKPTTQRTAGGTHYGWRRRRLYTITNGSGNPLVRYPYAIDLGLTNGLVTGGVALASGNDVRLVYQGAELPRTLVNWNDATFATLAWFMIPRLDPGASMDIEVWYHNPQAGAPVTLGYPNAPAFDIATAGANRSTNLSKKFSPTNGWVPLWYTNTYAGPPATVDTQIPGAWEPVLTFHDPTNQDDTTQPFFHPSGANAYPVFYGRRARASGGSFAPNGYDGVAYTDAAGITGITCAFYWTNDLEGAAGSPTIGKLVVLYRNSSAERWQVLYSNVGTGNVASTTYAPAAACLEMAMAIWPRDEIAVSRTALEGRQASAENGPSTLTVTVANTVTQSLTVGEIEIYDHALALMYLGDGRDLPLNGWLSIGDPWGSGVRYAAPLNTTVEVDTAKRTGVLYATTGAQSAELWPGIVMGDEYWEPQGSARPSAHALPVRPYTNPLANPDFDANVAGWTGETAALAWFSPAEVGGGMSVAVTNLPNGGGALAIFNERLEIGGRKQVWLFLSVRPGWTLGSVVVAPFIRQYNAAGAQVATGNGYVWPLTQPALNTWGRAAYAMWVHPDAVTWAGGLYIQNNTGAALTGSVGVDRVAPLGNEYIVYRPGTGGTVELSAVYRPRFG